MNRYGQSITWSTLTAPTIFSGFCTSYSLRDALTEQLIDDNGGDNVAMALHGHKASLSFEAKVTVGTTNFLDLSAGAAVSVSTITGGGIILARRAVETWRLNQPKMASIEAVYFPDITQTSPVMAGTSLTAFTPTQTGLTIVSPGTEVIYGTYGMTHAAGQIQSLVMEQELQIAEDDETPAGVIAGAATHGYARRISMGLLATGSIPAVASTLVITNGPTHSANYLIKGAELVQREKRGMLYQIEATWIPPLG